MGKVEKGRQKYAVVITYSSPISAMLPLIFMSYWLFQVLFFLKKKQTTNEVSYISSQAFRWLYLIVYNAYMILFEWGFFSSLWTEI